MIPKEFVLLSAYIILLAIITAKRRVDLLRVALVIFVLSFAWVLALGNIYSYNTSTVVIAGVNLFALAGWSLGLLVGYLIFLGLNRRFKLQTWWQKLILFNLFYIPLLIAAEFIAYHWFGVVNSGTAMYQGLPICNCLHAPAWMKLGYFSMGSISFVLVLLYQKVSQGQDQSTLQNPAAID